MEKMTMRELEKLREKMWDRIFDLTAWEDNEEIERAEAIYEEVKRELRSRA